MTWLNTQLCLEDNDDDITNRNRNDIRRKRQGYGTVLMKHGLISCDRDNKLTYLESSNPDNIPFYERQGFELLGTIQVGASPPIFPLLRYPLSKV